MLNKFKIKDENGIEREATVLTKLESEGNNYLIYTVDRDEENTNIFVSKIITDLNGNNTITDILDQNEKQKIDELTKQIIKIVAE